MKRILSLFCAVVLMLSICSLSVSAETMDSFRHDDQPGGSVMAVNSRAIYTAVRTINSETLGIEKSLEGLTDICDSPDGTIYVLCGDNSCLFLLNKDYSFKSELNIKDTDGKDVDFTGAKGIFVDRNNTIYIADTGNARVLIVNQEGVVNDIWNLPESSLIPEDLIYQPVSITVDDSGYIYILSSGCYYGALSYNQRGEFLGFYGASTVEANALDTLSYLWDRLTSNDEKKEQSIKKIPYSFVDFAVDSDGYMVTCTGNTKKSDNGSGQIRKISPDGSNILYKRDVYGDFSSSTSVNFLEKKKVFRLSNENSYSTQNIVSVDVDSKGFIYALDMVTGWIYLYDSQCNHINTFGGGFSSGDQQGIFRMPVSLMIYNSSVLVADASNNNITVFDITSYGEDFLNAQKMYIDGDYTDAKELWETVLSQDRSNQMAYRGLAMISYLDGDYKTALEYAKNGLDYNVYDMAWKEVSSNFMSDNFVWIFLLCILIIGAIIAFIIIAKKRNLLKIKNPKVTTLLSVVIHPFNSFNDIKYKNYGSIMFANIIVALMFIAFSLEATCSGFMFTKVSSSEYNLFFTIVKTIGLVLIWSLCNWLVCSLFSGKGKLGEVYIATAYSLIPLIAFTFIRVILSNFISLSAEGLISGIGTAIWIYTFFLLCVAMITIHEFDFFKFVTTSLVVVFLMVLLVFVIFMVAILIMQFWDFITSVYSEAVYR